MNSNGLSSGVGRVKGRFESRRPSKTIKNHPRPHSYHQKVQTNHRTSLLRRRTYLPEVRSPRAKRDRNASFYEFDSYSKDNSKTTTKKQVRSMWVTCEKHTGVSSLTCEDSTVSKAGPIG